MPSNRSNHARGLRWLQPPPLDARCSRRAMLLAGAAALAGGSINPLQAAPNPTRASTSRQAYEEALRHLPLDELAAADRARVLAVVSEPSLYRRLPVEVVDCDPELYLFLVRHPEVVVSMWQLMGVTKVKVTRTDDTTLSASDGAGTQSKVEFAHHSRDKHVVIGSGFYEGPLFRRRLTGECVLLLQSGYSETPAGRVLVSNQLDVFVSLENVGAEFVAKTLHPLVGKTADHNFSESTRFLGQISQQAELNQTGMRRLAARLTSIREDVRTKFVDVVDEVGDRVALRVAANPRGARRDLGPASSDDRP